MKATVVLQPNGRLVIPATIRQHLTLRAGQKLEVTLHEGRIILTPQIEHLRRAQALLSAKAKGDNSRWSEELLAERRAETERE